MTDHESQQLDLLRSDEVPQHRTLAHVVQVVRYVAGRSEPPPVEPRHLNYCRQAARAIGWLGPEGELTEAGREIARGRYPVDGPEAMRRAARQMAQARVFRLWMKWQGTDRLEALRPEGALAFLDDVAPSLAPATRKHRAGALRRWLKAAVPKQPQLDFDAAPPPVDPLVCPNNEGAHRARQVVRSDLGPATDVHIVAGYGSLVELANAVVELDFDHLQRLRLHFGSEIHPGAESRATEKPAALAREVREYWLKRGVSLLHAASWLEAVRRIEDRRCEARLGHRDGRVVHAKAVITERGLVTGSSNFTIGGLERNHEVNVRLDRASDRHEEPVRLLAESFWDAGMPYTDELRALMHSLLRPVTWREALARACVEVLDGSWAKRALPLEDLEALRPPLWTHQREALGSLLWLFENVGLILVADAAGSGKTRVGAWAFRAVRDRLAQERGVPRNPIVICPPAVRPEWRKQLLAAGVSCEVFTDAALSHPESEEGRLLHEALMQAELVLLDEAHRFLSDRSRRTRRLLAAGPEHLLAFTATPINRGATDFWGLMELLGADHFDDETVSAVEKIARAERRGLAEVGDSIEIVQSAFGACMIRRTRAELVARASESDQPVPSGAVRPRYPELSAEWYALPSVPEDEARLFEIRRLADELRGLHRLPKDLRLSTKQTRLGWTDERYVHSVVASAASLARYIVLAMLRSSRAAAYGHVLGNSDAIKQFGLARAFETHGGDTLSTLRAKAGTPPTWSLQKRPKALEGAPVWLWSAKAHADTAEADAAAYRRIAELIAELSPARENAKAAKLAELAEDGKVLAFDHHVLTLVDMRQRLENLGIEPAIFVGSAGKRARQEVLETFGRGSKRGPRIALLSDALNEGVNLQAAAAILHLDWPTVLRVAEQRTGRIDRMDSQHETVRVLWPQETGALGLDRSERRLFERNALVRETVGANLELPIGLEDEIERGVDNAMDLEQVRDRATYRDDSLEVMDAFAPVRGLVGEGRLVSWKVYDAMKDTEADIVACVSLVPSETPWAFFCVGHTGRRAPQWVAFEDLEGAPRVGLRVVTEVLRDRLERGPADHPIDRSSLERLQHFVQRLDQHREALLPRRHQRVLALLRSVLPEYLVRARRSRKEKDNLRRIRLLHELGERLSPSRTSADLGKVTQTLWRLLAPYREHHLADRIHRKSLMRTVVLEQHLLDTELSDDALEALLDSLPDAPPPSERTVAAIVGVGRS